MRGSRKPYLSKINKMQDILVLDISAVRLFTNLYSFLEFELQFQLLNKSFELLFLARGVPIAPL